MLRKILLAGGLAALAAHHVHAQSIPAAHMHGVWEGTYTSNHAPPGPLKITIANDSVISATMEFGTEIKVPPSSFKSITHEGDRVKWTQELMGTACEGTGAVDGDKFKGEIRCGPAVISFSVAKRAR